jgi:hypothetical protein
MQLEINDNLPISALQVKFSQSFPYLKLEFYTKAHRWQGASEDKNRVPPHLLIGAIRHKKTSGVYAIKSATKTGQVERDFKRIYGLQVQVFRLQDEGWVQTTGTDDLTLQQQMDLAKGMHTSSSPATGAAAEEEDEGEGFSWYLHPYVSIAADSREGVY